MAQRDSTSEPLTSQLKERAKDFAGQAKEQTRRVAVQTRDQVQGLVTQQKDRVASRLGSLAGTLREAGDEAGIGRYAGRAADQVDRLSVYLQDRDLREVVRDAESFARRRPAVFLGGTFLAGLLLARFLKASGGRQDGLETTPA
jgi:hypothetical protein